MTNPAQKINETSLTGFAIQNDQPLGRQFDSLAAFLLKGNHLVVANARFEILEVEFYLNSPQHPDPFTHGSEAQSSSGRWYLHKTSGNNTKYNGLDITIGENGSSKGGILLRTLRDVKTKEVVEGPSNITALLSEKLSAKNLTDLSSTLAASHVEDHHQPIYLEWNGTTTYLMVGKSIIKSPRVNLSWSNRANLELRKRFIMAPYRYTVKGHKFLNQRSTIFLSFYQLVQSEELAQRAAYVRATEGKKYLEAFLEGQRLADLDSFFGNTAMDCYQLCRFYGAWAKLQANLALQKTQPFSQS